MGTKATELVLDAVRGIGVWKFGVALVGGLSTIIGVTWTVAVLWTQQADPATVRQNTADIDAMADSMTAAHSRFSAADRSIESRLDVVIATSVNRSEYVILNAKMDRMLCRLDGNSAEYCEQRHSGDGP